VRKLPGIPNDYRDVGSLHDHRWITSKQATILEGIRKAVREGRAAVT
jgi:hypothetical protein